MSLTDKQRLGEAAEALALLHLEKKGFTLCDRNVCSKWGELDLVVQRGELVCFVEVRARTRDSYGGAAASVTWAKQRRVVRAAREYVFRRKLNSHRLRFDVVTVQGRLGQEQVSHIEGAFDAGAA
ncbi:MAG: YraN family protein [Myxococcaceae bacterium]